MGLIPTIQTLKQSDIQPIAHGTPIVMDDHLTRYFTKNLLPTS